MKSYPVCLFLFNRPNLVSACLDAISKSSKNNNIDLYIFIDGPRNQGDESLVNQTIRIVNNFDYSIFNKVSITNKTHNYGLANSVISGVNKIFEDYREVIVIEDDLIVSKNFISFMIDALKKFEVNKRVGSISGFSFAIRNKSSEDIYFHPRPNSWGWATWKDRWNQVEWEVDSDYLKKINYTKKGFNKLGQDMDRMLQAYILKKIDSWAIRWALSHWTNKWLALSPYKSKVINKGFGDPNATNTFLDNNFKVLFDDTKKNKNFVYPKETIVIPRNHKIINKYNSNILRISQKFLPNIFWKLMNNIIYKYY